MARSGGASYQEDADVLEALKRIIRVGVVQSYNAETRMARVKFEDKGNIKPAPLKCVARPRHIAPNKEPPDQEDDLVKVACSHCPHQHEAYVMDWNPKPGAWVLCFFMPGGGGDGYVVGEV